MTHKESTIALDMINAQLQDILSDCTAVQADLKEINKVLDEMIIEMREEGEWNCGEEV